MQNLWKIWKQKKETNLSYKEGLFFTWKKGGEGVLKMGRQSNLRNSQERNHTCE